MIWWKLKVCRYNDNFKYKYLQIMFVGEINEFNGINIYIYIFVVEEDVFLFII